MKKLLGIFGCSKGRTRITTSTKPPEKEDESKPDESKKEEEKKEDDIVTQEPKENEEKKEEEEKKENSIQIVEEEKKEEFQQSKFEFGKNGLNSNKDINDTDPLIDSNSPLICPYEKGIITFTKNGMVDFFNTLENMDGYKEFYNKKNLKIEIRTTGSPLNSEFYLIKALYTQKKSELGKNANYDNIVKIMYDVNVRNKWDKAIKKVEKFEGSDEVFTCRTWANAVLIISEREGIEKRMVFKKDNKQYVLSTSVPDDYIPEEKGVVRITNYVNFFRATEDEENYYFLTINQSDFKMVLPQFIINLTLPMKTNEWFEAFQKVAEKMDLNEEEKKDN